MPFVVRITGHTGNVTWLTRPNKDGIRTLGIRSKADVFATETDARVAIATMPQPFKESGLIFSIESDQ